MAREQQHREVETFDMVNDEADGALDWNMLRTGVPAIATVGGSKLSIIHWL